MRTKVGFYESSAPADMAQVTAIPKPSTGTVLFRFGPNACYIERMILLDALGRPVKQEWLGRSEGDVQVDLAAISGGSYRADFLDGKGQVVGWLL